jgi:hypothetical protein
MQLRPETCHRSVVCSNRKTRRVREEATYDYDCEPSGELYRRSWRDHDRRQQCSIEKGLDVIGGNLQQMVAKGKLTAAQRETALGSIRGTTALEDLARDDVVIEAVTEEFELKANILKRLDGLVRADTIIASATSSISISKLASTISHPGRIAAGQDADHRQKWTRVSRQPYFAADDQ